MNMNKLSSNLFSTQGYIIILSIITHTMMLFIINDGYVYDTISYIREGSLLFNEGIWSGIRLPGYPLLMAFSIALTNDILFVRILAIGFSALACLAVMRLTTFIAPNGVNVAGIIFALFPTSLTLVPIIIPEAISAYLVIIGIATLVEKKWFIGFLSIMSAQLLRPHLAPLAIVIIPMIYFLPDVPKRRVLYAIPILVIVPFILSITNLAINNDFTPSTTSNMNLNTYFMARVEAGNNTQRMIEIREQIANELEQLEPLTVNERNEYHAEQSKLKIKEFGIVQTALTLINLSLAQIFAAPGMPIDLPPFIQFVNSILWIIYVILAIIGWIMLLMKRQWWVTWLIIGFLFFCTHDAILAGWSGARLRSPGDLMLIPLIAYTLTQLRSRKQKQPSLTLEI